MGVLKRLGLYSDNSRRPYYQGQALLNEDGRSVIAATIGRKTTPEEDNPDHEALTGPLERALTEAVSAVEIGSQTLAIVRSALWMPEGDDCMEETWHLPVPRHATVADVKAAIARIHNIPVSSQHLQATPNPGDIGLTDEVCVDNMALLRRPLHLLPTEEAMHEFEAAAAAREQFEAEMREAAEAAEAIERSLATSSYKLRFVAPEGAGGRVAGQDVTLDIPALAPAGQVQAMVECALFGSEAESPRGLCLAHSGQVLPPQVPIHLLGIADGETLLILDRTECFSDDSADGESDSDSLDEGILKWAFK